MTISALNRKLLRDLFAMKGQAFAIAMVVAAGVSMYVMYLSNFASLQQTRTAYYDRQRFGDVFASLKRAPLRVADDIADLPGVSAMETRVVANVTLDLEQLDEPASGRLISIPSDRRPRVNDLFLRRGRWIEPGRPDEVLASEGFVAAHGLNPGDTVPAIINGRLRRLTIVGVALSPEYIYSIRPGELVPDDKRFGVARVERGPMQVTIDEEGETRVRERFVVSAPVSGRLQRVELEPGDPVKRGETVVARLTPAPAPLIDPRTQGELTAASEAARAAIGQAQAERDRAAAALARARSSLRRQEALAEVGAISRDDLESAQTTLRSAEEALRVAEFTVARAQYELQLARARLAPSSGGGRTVDVVAPVDGVVLRRMRESESVVPVGDPLLEIGDPNSLEIVADLLSTDAVRVSPGDPVQIEQWGGSGPLEARVRRVEPSGFMKVSALGVEEQRVNVIVDLVDVAAAARHLGDGYRAEVRIVIWREDAALKAPIGSLFRRGDDWAVFVVEAERVRLQPVKLGQRNDTEGQVLEGLSERQTVVMHPPDTLADGARVRFRGAER